MLNCGDTFYWAESDDEEPHLRIIVTPPEAGEVAIVSVTSRHKKSETLVCLEVGDHPFIKHSSVIAYAYSKIVSVDEIELLLQSGSAKLKGPVNAPLLKRIQAGLLDSDFTPNGVRYFCRNLKP